MNLETQPNGWAFLIALVGMLGAILTPIVTYLLSRAHATTREAKLDRVQATVAKTQVIVNGDRLAKEAKIAAYEAQMRAAGIEPAEPE